MLKRPNNHTCKMAGAAAKFWQIPQKNLFVFQIQFVLTKNAIG